MISYKEMKKNNNLNSYDNINISCSTKCPKCQGQNLDKTSKYIKCKFCGYIDKIEVFEEI